MRPISSVALAALVAQVAACGKPERQSEVPAFRRGDDRRGGDAFVPAGDDLDATRLEQVYLERWCDVPAGLGFTEPGRQILHCTFGSTLTDPELGPAIRSVLESHPETYTEILADHFSRHLDALAQGM